MATKPARTTNCHGGGPRGGRRSAPNATSYAAFAGHRNGLAPLALRAYAHDVPRESAQLERTDDHRRRVDLPAAEPVHRGGRERVVVVVPRLAERRQRQPEHVA